MIRPPPSGSSLFQSGQDHLGGRPAREDRRLVAAAHRRRPADEIEPPDEPLLRGGQGPRHDRVPGVLLVGVDRPFEGPGVAGEGRRRCDFDLLDMLPERAVRAARPNWSIIARAKVSLALCVILRLYVLPGVGIRPGRSARGSSCPGASSRDSPCSGRSSPASAAARRR